MKNFKNYLLEINAASSGGVFGGGDSFGHGGLVGNFDFYAGGDSRIPQILGTFSRAGKVAKKKNKNKLKNAVQRKNKGKFVGKRRGSSPR